MENGVIISDAGPIFSLAIIDKLEILDKLFDEIYIPKAVWEELTRDKTTAHYQRIVDYFKDKTKEISGFNDLTFVMDYGESEAVILYKELKANYLLIDDKKARDIAENFGIQCIGTIGILSIARERKMIDELKTLFEVFLQNKRYYSLKLLNAILKIHDEEAIKQSI
ncbi:MAG: putative nucleic acid-binding protein [Paraglaciecola sp.]|jgi:predicted nucleic acid-binding protein